MVKILIVLDSHEKIEKVSMNESPLNLHEGMSIGEFFPDSTKEALSTQVQNCKISESSTTMTSQILIENKAICVTVFLMCFGNSVAMLIIDSEALDVKSQENFLALYNEYINIMREEFRKAIRLNQENQEKPYLEIQQLNNELINTKRQLQRANGRLNRVIETLEGRIVKDALTGLISRYQYWTEIENSIQLQPGKQGIFAFIDLDDFKAVNDTFGHAAGDQFLITFARRLNQINQAHTIKIRIAGDEFALFSYGYDEVKNTDIKDLWQSIQDLALSQPIVVNGIKIPVSISCGMAIFRKDTEHIAELIEYSDFAMYQAKNNGKGGYEIFDKALYSKHLNNEEVRDEVLRVINEEDFYHVLQPIVDSKSKEIVGYSVQLKTQSNMFESTEDFIKKAYALGLYQQVDQKSIQAALKNQEILKVAEGKKLVLTHGPYPFNQEVLFDYKDDKLRNIQLVFEMWLPLNLQAQEIHHIQSTLELSNSQIAFANYRPDKGNALVILAMAPSYLRLDREFLQTTMQDDKARSVIEKIIRYGHLQNTRFIGDHVEDEKLLQYYRSLDIDYIQSYLVGEPSKLPTRKE